MVSISEPSTNAVILKITDVLSVVERKMPRKIISLTPLFFSSGVILASMMRKYCPMNTWEWIRAAFYTTAGIIIALMLFGLMALIWHSAVLYSRCERGEIKGIIFEVKK